MAQGSGRQRASRQRAVVGPNLWRNGTVLGPGDRRRRPATARARDAGPRQPWEPAGGILELAGCGGPSKAWSEICSLVVVPDPRLFVGHLMAQSIRTTPCRSWSAIIAGLRYHTSPAGCSGGITQNPRWRRSKSGGTPVGAA